MDKREHFYSVGGKVNWCGHYGKQYGGSLKKKLKIELPYDPAIPLLSIHLDKILIQEDTCALNILSSNISIAKMWKHLSGHGQSNGYRRCERQWNITQSIKGMK